MTKLYSLLFVLFATSMAYSAQEGGKLPEDFKFNQCSPDDDECLEKRVSFLRQWQAHQRGNLENDLYESDSNLPISRRSGKYLPYQETVAPTLINVNIPENMEYKTVCKGNVIDIIVTHKSSQK
jgi:hypothetical protein